jgi:hypothetical protein
VIINRSEMKNPSSGKLKRRTFILVLDKDDPEKELEFELDFQASLTAAERYEIMDRLAKDGLEFVKRNGYKSTPAFVAQS